MGQKYKGTFDIPGGFSNKGSSPILDNMVVEKFNDLLNNEELPFIYQGIIVYVEQEDAHYTWNGKDRADAANWKSIGGIFVDTNNFVNTNNVTETVGGFFAGEPATPIEGLTKEEFNNKLLFPAIRPTISFNINSLTLERGSDYSEGITINFTQGGAGNLISYSLEKDGAEISTTQVTQFEQNNVRANFTLQGKVSHEAAVTISAGTISTQSVTIRQRLRIWFAPLSSVPNTSTDVRGMSSNAFDNANSLNLNTGTTNKTFVVAVPTEVTNAASLSAQDVTNNVPYTYNFIRTVDVVLPDNITEEYRVYALVVDNAYSLAANHIIQI